MTTSLLSCSTDGETVLTQEVKRPKRVGRERRWLKFLGEAGSRRWSRTEYRAAQDKCGWREGEEDKAAVGTGSLEMH